MKKITVILFMVALLSKVTLLPAQSLYFPPVTGTQWETMQPSSLGWCTDKIEPLYDYLGSINSKAFIVLKDGRIVLEKYFGTFTQDSIWYWASAGKSLTAFLVGLAQQEGYLSIYDTTSNYLGTGWTSCTPGSEEKITIWHQLTMTTGLDDGVPDNHCTLPECLQCLADPGTRWAYHNAPYTLLDGVITSATGQSLNLYLYNKLTPTTGLSGLFIKSGYDNIFFSKPRSMARFGLLMLNKGKWDTTPVMTDTAYFRQMTNTSQSLNLAYGYLWWLNGKASLMVPGLQYVFPGSFAPHAPADMIAAMGKNGQFLDVVPSQNIVTVRLGNAPGEGDVPFLYNDSIWLRLNEVICNSTPVKESIPADRIPVVSPDPSNDKCVVSWEGQEFSIAVFDGSGRILLHKKVVWNSAEIETRNFPEGLYYLRLVSRNKAITRKLVVLH